MDSFIMFNPLNRLDPSRDETEATSYLTMLRNFQIKLLIRRALLPFAFRTHSISLFIVAVRFGKKNEVN